MDEAEELLHYWGYAKIGENRSGFFDYKGKASEKNVGRFEEFKKQNERTMQWLLEKDTAIREIQFPVNKGKEGYKLIAEKKNLFDLSKIQSIATIKEHRD